MFTPRPIGFVSSPYKNPGEVPRGLGTRHAKDFYFALIHFKKSGRLLSAASV